MIASSMVCFCVLTCLRSGEASTNSSTLPVAKCDKDILDKIRKFQCLEGRPGNLIKTAINNDIEFSRNTTPGCYPSNITCVYTKFVADDANYTSATVQIFLVYNTNITHQRNLTVYEECGSLYDPSTKIDRLHIAINHGVTVMYICIKDDNALPGPPTFLMKCAMGHCDPANLAYGAHVMESIGYSAREELAACGAECV